MHDLAFLFYNFTYNLICIFYFHSFDLFVNPNITLLNFPSIF